MSDGGTPVSGNRLSVVPEQVRDVGKYFYELAEKLRTALDSAAMDVDAVANGIWTGGLAVEFADGWSDVRDDGGQIIAALAAMAEKLGVTAETYRTLDESNASTLNTSSLDLP
ncbi:type VII secretion target [Nocardia pseudovaccinii]|uniref:type VII secretion target n=1 Tax=Nocardia pseudovaccinii TaxID=189540 RepID=UPI0007A38021|nr:type VII secretion target [Nocardia pseudovaccinii]